MSKHYFYQLKRFLVLYKSNILKCSILSIAINSIYVLLLYQFKTITDKYIPEHNTDSIYKIFIILLLMVFINYIFHRIYLGNLNKITFGIQYAIRRDVFAHTQKIKYDYFSQKSFGQINTNIIQDVESLCNCLFQRLVNSISQILYCIATLIILLGINIYLSLVLFGFIILFSLIIIKLKNKMEEYTESFAKSRAKLNENISDVVDGAKIISLYNLENNFITKLKEVNKEYNLKWLKTNIFSPLIQSSIEIAILITYLLVFILGGVLISNHSLTVGGLFLYIGYLPQIWGRYGSVVDIFSGFLNTGIFAERVLGSFETEVHEETVCHDNKIVNLCRNGRASIFITDIDFCYKKHYNIFHGFSAEFSKPGIYCIVGESGSGKSTLFDLLLGFYKVNGGEIKVNNIDVNDYPLNELRKQIGIVHQEPYIISDTVIENIRFGDITISDSRIIELSKSLGFDKYISIMDDSYYSEIGSKDVYITSGQKRIISILRVLVRDPDILLLDEITSNVDSYTELLIHKVLDDLSRKKICLFITHKEKDMLLADEIIKLN